MWYSHMMPTCEIHGWSPHVVYCISCCHIIFTCGVLHLWTSHVVLLYYVTSYVESTCGVQVWSLHMIYNMYRMRFTVYDLPYMESTCGVPLKSYTDINSTYGKPHVVFRMWSSYVEFVSVRMWSSHVDSTCDLARWSHTGPYVITCGNHMWSWLPYVESTCGIFRMWSPHVDLFSLVMFLSVGVRNAACETWLFINVWWYRVFSLWFFAVDEKIM